jgi:hypothetical protein
MRWKPIIKASSSRIKASGLHFFAGLILCFTAFYNLYPLLYPDTGGYILSGYGDLITKDRPMFYGWFLRHTSMYETLWFTVIIQGMTVSYVLFESIKAVTKTSKPFALYFFCLLVLVCFTGISVNVSMLIPDFFTPVVILSLFLLIFAHESTWTTRILTFFIFAFSVSSHTSHLPIVFGAMGLFTLAIFVKWRRTKEIVYRIKHLLVTWTSIIVVSFSVPLSNYFLINSFSLSTTSHVFFMHKLHETGILTEYMNEYCGKRSYELCKYNGQIPWDFLWDPASPLYKTGGWENSELEYKRMIKDILNTPKYRKRYIVKSLVNSCKVFFSFDIDNPGRQDENSAPYQPIQKYFNHSIYEFWSASQQSGRLNFNLMSHFQTLLYLGSLLFVVPLLVLRRFRQKISRPALWFAFFVLAGMFCNALVSGFLASMSTRFQNRVCWLLPLAAMLIAFDLLRGTEFSHKLKTLLRKRSDV